MSSIKKALDQLPVTLDETYDRILRGIEPSDSNEAFNILQWLAFAERPLTLEEVAEAAVTNEDGSPIDAEERLFDPYDVVRICRSLISFAEDTILVCGNWTSGKVVRFAHFSVKEYLLSSRVLEGKARNYHMNAQSSQRQIGQSCLSALLQNDGVNEDQPSPLAKYAAQYWFQHFRKLQACTDDASNFQHLVEELFLGSRNTFRHWLLVYDVNIRRGHDSSSVRRHYNKFPAPLYYASFLGLGDTVRLLLDSGANVDAHGGYYGTPLIAAASQGHLAIVKILLNYNADINADGGWTFYTALQAASYFGYQDIAEVLLDSGSEPDRRQDDVDNTALGLACEVGHRAIVELLISRGSDVNLFAGGYVSTSTFPTKMTLSHHLHRAIPSPPLPGEVSTTSYVSYYQKVHMSTLKAGYTQQPCKLRQLKAPSLLYNSSSIVTRTSMSTVEFPVTPCGQLP